MITRLDNHRNSVIKEILKVTNTVERYKDTNRTGKNDNRLPFAAVVLVL
jgi:hypothetical protein